MSDSDSKNGSSKIRVIFLGYYCNFLANLTDIFLILLVRKFLQQRYSTLGTVVPLTMFLGGDGMNLGVNRAAQAFKKPLGNKKEERLQR